MVFWPWWRESPLPGDTVCVLTTVTELPTPKIKQQSGITNLPVGVLELQLPIFSPVGKRVTGVLLHPPAVYICVYTYVSSLHGSSAAACRRLAADARKPALKYMIAALADNREL